MNLCKKVIIFQIFCNLGFHGFWCALCPCPLIKEKGQLVGSNFESPTLDENVRKNDSIWFDWLLMEIICSFGGMYEVMKIWVGILAWWIFDLWMRKKFEKNANKKMESDKMDGTLSTYIIHDLLWLVMYETKGPYGS